MKTRLYYHETDGGAIYMSTAKVKGTEKEGALIRGSVVARLDGDPELTPLYAAAPDLLAALERAVEAAENPGKDYDWIGEASAALAKARGE